MKVPPTYPKPWCAVAKGQVNNKKWVIMVEGYTKENAVDVINQSIINNLNERHKR